ncbi:hypothetical protein PMZ80_000137 [Knufia obscura]|uniref:Peptidase S28 n=2 Tax=Knufia TaxID=430999 RepID=A0AAN8EME0_9EURO|nr:hypothetical protein PMZ80_000137 [Knufia obscura]KAK5956935.1 hypothetical protein OHC33_002424 [Knufia fluminis]
MFPLVISNLLALVLLPGVFALAGLPFHQRHFLPHAGGLTTRQLSSINGSDYPPEWVTIPVDHFNTSDDRTFQNRYWTNTSFYKPGGPIFWFDAGEQNAQPLVPYFLAEVAGPSAVMTLARRFGGLAVLVEHRFYGGLEEGSYPYPINASTGMVLDPQGYAYLNTEQALEDTVYFANHFEPARLEDHWGVMKPNSTPWIWLGGSYPGIRGSQLRIRNPDTFYATWASSAPTEAATNMSSYYAQAERSMTRNCSADFTAVTRYVDSILTNGTEKEIADLKIALYTAISGTPADPVPTINETEAQSLTPSDIGNLLLTPFSFYQYYGFEASVLPFCDILETQNRTTISTTDNGGTAPSIAPASGLFLETNNITLTWHNFLTALAQIDYDSIESPTPPDPVQGYSWTWQYCSEYGYYQIGNESDPHTIQSRFVSEDYFQAGCNATFPTLAENGILPPRPNVSAPNKYGGWDMRPSNTLFTSGQYDPWRGLSPASTEIDSPHRRSVQDIPSCNQPPERDDIFGLVYRDMVHVSDMRLLLNESDYYHQNFSTVGFSSPISAEPYFAGTALFERALEEWLPCFGR